MQEPPEGYIIVEDENYITKTEDLYYFTGWGTHPWVSLDKYYKAAINCNLAGLQEGFPKNNRFFVATKGQSKPRFDCGKPYPFGY